MKRVGKGQGIRKPAGGFILMRAEELLCLWAAFSAKIIRLVDLRVYLACKELVARRSGARKGVKPRYQITELHKLVGGVGGKRLEASIRRLEQARFLHWSTEAIVFSETVVADVEAESVSLTRLVPIPRRLLRYIAGGTTRVMTATILGHLLRCVFYHRGVCTSEGACKASWIAETFGVDERNVKKARARLIALGWLQPVDATQWRKNRWGGSFRVVLSWSGSVDQAPALPPPPQLSTTQTPPPESDKHPLREYKNQEPGSAFCEKEKNGADHPSLRHVVPDDLSETSRLLVLHAHACEAGLAKPGEAGRLLFIALAEHARRYGTRNPCGLFASLLRRQQWSFVNQLDEDCARLRLQMNRPGVAQAALTAGALMRVGSILNLANLVAQRRG